MIQSQQCSYGQWLPHGVTMWDPHEKYGVDCKSVNIFQSVFWRKAPGKRMACIAAQSACYIGPELQNCPRWLEEGAKGVLVYMDQKTVALVRGLHWCKTALHWCKRLLGGHLFSRQRKKNLLHLLLTTLGNFEVSGLCSRHSGSQGLHWFVAHIGAKYPVFGSRLPGTNAQVPGSPHDLIRKRASYLLG